MARDLRDELRSIRTFPSLVRFLRDELDWPVERVDFEELTFDYTPEELGIDKHSAAKIQVIKRLRPLSPSQPWGIFFVKFEPKRLPVVALRRILGRVALKKRASANSAERAAWRAEDLLFISNFGEGEERRISFAHFSPNDAKSDLPTLKVLGWDNLDTPLHLDHIGDVLTELLVWPDDENDVDGWRVGWRSAFTLRHREVVTTSKQLSLRLAELARGIRDRIATALSIETKTGPLTKLMNAFRESLVHDLDVDGFADMYAQTIAYGLLSARIADPEKKTADDFAGHMRTNPFLREMMETFLRVGGRKGRAGQGPGLDFDELGVSEVVELLDDANMEAVVRDFGDRNPLEDPVIHFYEHFLAAYDKRQKVSRGVFYTPRPVVSFIVRSVDDSLRSEFGLDDGLADTATWSEVASRNPSIDIPDGIVPEHPFVQILDPATGTGTFLVEVIDLIHRAMVEKWRSQGCDESRMRVLWNDYVPKHLLPRLHGYELLMAPYAIAHLKVGLKLFETGYDFWSGERARVYLTNALEPAGGRQLTLEFLPALAHEAKAVNDIKSRQRFTAVIGNPPYSNFGRQNRNDWIGDLLAEYKRGLGERKINLDDDYIKFIRLGQHLVERSGVGVLCYISNNSFIDGVTHRRMRQSLLQAATRVSIVDLHGSSKRKETTPDGSADENVFDIQQGVAVSLFRRLLDGARECHVDHVDVWGSRSEKYDWLASRRRRDPDRIAPRPPRYLLIPANAELQAEFDSWVAVPELFTRSTTAVQTGRDRLCVGISPEDVMERMLKFADLTVEDAEITRATGAKDARGWCMSEQRAIVAEAGVERSRVIEYDYRPFDVRCIYFDEDVIAWPRRDIVEHVVGKVNLALLATRGTEHPERGMVLATRRPADKRVLRTAKGEAKYYCAYSYRADLVSDAVGLTRVSNIASIHLDDWESRWRGSPDLDHSAGLIAYVYALLNSRLYIERYEAFLKLDHARVPMTAGPDLCSQLVELGSRLIECHLLEADDQCATGLTVIGDGGLSIERVTYSDCTIWFNAARTQGVSGVPEEAWRAHVGGYQVCRKWLSDRKGHVLTDEDVAHFQRVVLALLDSIQIVSEIDNVIIAHGGWPGAFSSRANAE